jgi:RNA polymerase sigma factor (sigma-70 family)
VNARLLAELRPVGFAVAYRMLGSVSEAEDIVQEAFLRLHHTLQDGERIESPRAYLSTVVTRLCINHLRSARARRETYLEALPEPLVGEAGAAVALVPASGPAGVADTGDPASQAEMADSLSLAFLVLLETLSPEQRAAFLLREVFDYRS